MRFINKEHIQILKKEYFNENTKSENKVYKTWMEHKYVHSIEVTEIGIVIIENEPKLNSLPLHIKEEFALALLYHDYARAKEIDSVDAKPLGIDHSTQGARDIFELGHTSPNIIIPIMLHSRIDESFILADDKVLKNRFDFKKLSKNDKDFVLKMRKVFNGLSEEEKKIVLLGIALVRDADKIANIQFLERMMDSSYYVRIPKVTPEALEDFYERRLVDIRNMNTMADAVIVYLSWCFDLNFDISREIIMRQDIIERSKKYSRDQFKDADQKDVQKFINILDDAGRFLDKFFINM